MSTRSKLGAVLATLLIATTVQAQPLRTNLDAYLVFALRNAGLKNPSVLGACNVGCATCVCLP